MHNFRAGFSDPLWRIFAEMRLTSVAARFPGGVSVAVVLLVYFRENGIQYKNGVCRGSKKDHYFFEEEDGACSEKPLFQ